MARAERRARPVRQRATDLAWFAAATAVVLAASLAIDGDHVGALEERTFRWVNEGPDFLYPGWWALMQYGTFITIPLAAGALVTFVGGVPDRTSEGRTSPSAVAGEHDGD